VIRKQLHHHRCNTWLWNWLEKNLRISHLKILVSPSKKLKKIKSSWSVAHYLPYIVVEIFNSCNSPLKINKTNWDAMAWESSNLPNQWMIFVLSKSSYDKPRSRLGLNFVQGTQKLCLNLAWLHRRSESIFLKVVSASKHSSKTVKVYLHFFFLSKINLN
jgi:hypothetical protein